MVMRLSKKSHVPDLSRPDTAFATKVAADAPPSDLLKIEKF